MPESRSFLEPKAPGTRALAVLGTMNFGQRTPEREAEAIIEAAMAGGIFAFDTANMYGDGASERILGKALEHHRGPVFVTSKVGAWRKGGKAEGLATQTIVEALQGSLERLRRPSIDLYLLHAPDGNTALDDTLDGITLALERQWIGAWGVSNFASWQVLELMHLCEKRGLPGPVVAQQLYNPLVRQLDVEYFAFARKYGLHTTIYNPLAGGLLVGKAGEAVALGPRLTSNAFYKKRYGDPALASLAQTLRGMAAEAGIPLFALTYAWLGLHPNIDSVLLGPATVPHLEDALSAWSLDLPSSTRRAMDAAYRSHIGTDATYAR